jgi:hypothetical protein
MEQVVVNGQESQDTELFENVMDQLRWFLDEIDKIPQTTGCLEQKIYALKAMFEFILLPQVKNLLDQDKRFNKLKNTLYAKVWEFNKTPYLRANGGLRRSECDAMYPEHGKLRHRFAETLAEMECYLAKEGKMRRRSSRLKLENINKYLDSHYANTVYTYDEDDEDEEREPQVAAAIENQSARKRVSVKVLPRRSARLMAQYAVKGTLA